MNTDNETGVYWIETEFACGGVVVENGLIVNAAPIFKRFINQHINALRQWQAIKQCVRVISDEKIKESINE